MIKAAKAVPEQERNFFHTATEAQVVEYKMKNMNI